MYCKIAESSEEGFTAEQNEDGSLDIRCESIHINISYADIVKSPIAGALIVAYINSVLQDTNK